MTNATKKSALRWPVRILFALLLAVVGILLGNYIQKDHGNSGTVSSEISGTSMTIADLDQSVMSQLVAPSPGGFGVINVSSVTCNPPDAWVPGKTFTCFVYDSSNHELGEFDATVTPADSSGTPRWNGGYTPIGP